MAEFIFEVSLLTSGCHVHDQFLKRQSIMESGLSIEVETCLGLYVDQVLSQEGV